MFRTGFIRSALADSFWFLGLPFVAVACALACQQWLTAVAISSISLWITAPHHFATWLRTYGLSEDWQRWHGRLILGPLLIAAAVVAGLTWAPITLLLVVMLWDNQHSLMQQHGFARIYDFKARTGAAATGRFDLMLACFLYGNLFLTTPMFTKLWLKEVCRLQIPISLDVLRTIQTASWTLTGICLCAYVGHMIWCLRHGYALNPIKYLFIAASYFLWYFTAWHTDSVLVWGVAHRIMHGLQYIVIVYWYLQSKKQQLGPKLPNRERWVQPRTVFGFVLMCAVYAVAYGLIARHPLEDFGFGVLHFMAVYQDAGQYGSEPMTAAAGYELYAAMIINGIAMLHYYFDSFIWRVREKPIQDGLT